MTYVITEYVRVIPSSPYVRVITSSQYVRVVTSYTSRPAKIRGPHGVTLRQHPASVRTALSPGPAARADSEQEDSGWKRQLQDLARQRDERYKQFYSFSSSVSFSTQEAAPGPGPPHTPLGPRLVRHPFLGSVSYPLAAPHMHKQGFGSSSPLLPLVTKPVVILLPMVTQPMVILLPW